MRKLKTKMMFVLLVSMLVVIQAAIAADSQDGVQAKTKYKKVTGEVVSMSATSIVIKGKSKKPVTLAVDEKTDMVGASNLKSGDKAAVNYRVEKSGGTATRIKLLSASVSPAAAPASEASSPTGKK